MTSRNAGIKERSKPTRFVSGLGKRRIATAREVAGGFFDDDKEGEDPNPSTGDLGGPPFSRGGGVNNVKRERTGEEVNGGDERMR